MSTSTTWSLSARGRTAIDAPYSGHGVSEFAYSAEWTSGTGDNQADLCGSKVQTVNATANVDVDLRAITDANGDALNGAELAALIIEVPVDASGAITLKRSTTNGVPFLNGTTDGMVLNAGSRVLLVFPEDGGPAMSASAKDINLANAGASNTDVTITTYQRSA
jgi:hypothetical protein